jgi:hypothetical protein
LNGCNHIPTSREFCQSFSLVSNTSSKNTDIIVRTEVVIITRGVGKEAIAESRVRITHVRSANFRGSTYDSVSWSTDSPGTVVKLSARIIVSIAENGSWTSHLYTKTQFWVTGVQCAWVPGFFAN